MIIKYLLNNLIFRMFSYNFYFNKFRKYRRRGNDNKFNDRYNKFNDRYNKFNKYYKYTHYNNDKIRFLKIIND